VAWLPLLYGVLQGITERKLRWSQQPVNMFAGAPFHLNRVMGLKHFLDITLTIRFTDKATPTVAREGNVDQFHKVRQILEEFSNHYNWSYLKLWLSCLDKSRNSWLSKFSPVFICVPCKPHPFGNKYHSIANGPQGKPIIESSLSLSQACQGEGLTKDVGRVVGIPIRERQPLKDGKDNHGDDKAALWHGEGGGGQQWVQHERWCNSIS
jgi:hypothetical protein